MRFRDKKGRFIDNESRTFLVARSIKEYGYAGINFIENAAKETAKDVEELFVIQQIK